MTRTGAALILHVVSQYGITNRQKPGKKFAKNGKVVIW